MQKEQVSNRLTKEQESFLEVHMVNAMVETKRAVSKHPVFPKGLFKGSLESISRSLHQARLINDRPEGGDVLSTLLEEVYEMALDLCNGHIREALIENQQCISVLNRIAIKINETLNKRKEEGKEEMIKNSVREQDVDNAIKNVVVQTLTHIENKPITLVTVELQNGFLITETSTPVSAENYNENVGKEMCMDRIRNKIWGYLGYVLTEEIHRDNVLNEQNAKAPCPCEAADRPVEPSQNHDLVPDCEERPQIDPDLLDDTSDVNDIEG